MTAIDMNHVFKRAFSLVCWTLFGLTSAHADNYPLRPITLVVPFAPGGGTDSIARDMARALSDKLGQAVVVDNKGGGGGALGANAVAKSAADGYTLLFATSTFVTNAASEASGNYQIEKDFAPIALIGRGPLLVVTSKSLGVKTMAQLKTTVATMPQGVDFCSAGNGSINHLAGELFRQHSGLNLTHIPYTGSGPATIDLLAGRVQLFFATVPTILPYVRDQRVELLAVTSAKRSPLFPNTPTMAESGYKDFDISTWWGVLGTGDGKSVQCCNTLAGPCCRITTAAIGVRGSICGDGGNRCGAKAPATARNTMSMLFMMLAETRKT
jgi:tripartite-type tricarboxylate transporter receptor subunit TctC